MPLISSKFIKTTGTGLATSRFIKPKTKDLNSIDSLQRYANQAGLGEQAQAIVEQPKKLSFLQRLGAGLGSFNPATSVVQGLEKIKAGEKPQSTLRFLGEYGKNIGKGLGTAITGKQMVEQKGFSDVFSKVGEISGKGEINNKVLKYGLGFVGDVLLDPTTYFGGTLVKGVAKGVGKVGGGALKGVGKVAPGVEAGIRMTGQGVKDALGKGFKFGYGTSKGLPEKTLEITNKLSMAKEGVVRSNIERLGTGTLAKSQQDELVEKLLGGKRAEFAVGQDVRVGKKLVKEAIKTGDYSKIPIQFRESLKLFSADPLVQKTIGEQITRSQKFAKIAGVEDPYTVYFPGLAKDKLAKFFEGTKPFKVGTQGYLKEFKNLLKDDELIRNPAQAFATREFEVVKDSIIKSELNTIVKQFGKPLNAFKNADDALKQGFQIVKEKGLFGKEVGWITKADKKFIDNLISPEFSSIDAIAKYTGFDAVTSLFKRSVTGLFVPFHIRNYVSGLIQNFEVLGIKALSPKNIALGQRMAFKAATNKRFGAETLKVGAKVYKLDNVMKPFTNRFGTSSSYIADIADATKGAGNLPGKILSKESFKETAKTLGLGQQAIPFRAARAIGNFIETQQKATAYVTALRNGSPVKEALKLAERAGFDYRALTGLESKVLRRIIPFYSFTRKNIELQLRTLGENPQRINQVIKFFDNLSKGIGGELTQEEKDALPDFAKEGFTAKAGEESGLVQVISKFGTPIEQFADLFGGRNPVLKQLSSFNPILKVPIELGIGKDSFRQRDIKDVFSAKEYSSAPQMLKDLLKIKPVEKDIYENNKKTGKKRIEYVADPERLLVARSLFTSRGVSYLDKIFDGDLKGFAKYLDLTTGLKGFSIDPETTKYFENRDKEQELKDLLYRYNVLKKFEIYYKEKKN